MNKRTAYRLIEEGSAFAELEERHMSRKIDSTPSSQDADVAPREAWDAIAADYDAFVTPGEAELATAALRSAGLRAGQSFLDVAAGTLARAGGATNLGVSPGRRPLMACRM